MNHTEMPAGAGRVAQLTESTVSPTLPGGRTPEGIPIEETVMPLAKYAVFVDRDGNLCKVALRTSRVLDMSSHSEKYEETMRKDQIAAGCLPLAECPYTSEYKRITNSPTLLGELPEGVKPCDGSPVGEARVERGPDGRLRQAGAHTLEDACEHLKPVIVARRKAARERYEASLKVNRMIPSETATEMVRALGEGLRGNAQNDAKAARQKLSQGKGEEG